jgi:hypothetical protein
VVAHDRPDDRVHDRLIGLDDPSKSLIITGKRFPNQALIIVTSQVRILRKD